MDTVCWLKSTIAVNNGIEFYELNVCIEANNKYDIIKCYVFADGLGEQALIRAAVWSLIQFILFDLPCALQFCCSALIFIVDSLMT